MATKKPSRKTAAGARAPRKNANGDSPKSTKTATVSPSAAARTPKAGMKPSAPQVELTAKAAKPAKTTRKAAAPRRRDEATPAKSAKSEPVAARLELNRALPASPSRDEIAARAAAIWREKGGAPFDNWIQAERELGA